MTEEVKEAVEAIEVKEEVKAETPAPETKVDPVEANKKLQGEKSFNKKKVNRFTKAECLEEIKRLEKAGHQQSSYYRTIVKQANSF